MAQYNSCTGCCQKSLYHREQSNDSLGNPSYVFFKRKVSNRYAKIRDVIMQEKTCKHFNYMFSPLCNINASDETSKSSLKVYFTH